MAATCEQVTAARARILRGLADGQTEREVAEALGLALSGVRSQVEDLKQITGCRDCHGELDHE